MADQRVLNEAPATTSQWFMVWRLFQLLLLSGWTVHYSSNGTTFSAADNWTGTGFAGLGSGSYVILTGKGGRQILLQRATTSTINGTVQYAYLGGWGTAGAGATTPPTAPASAVTIRSGAAWFGSALTPVRIDVWTRDVSGDGTFLVVMSTSTAWTSGGGGALGFFALEGTEGSDTEPYAWWAPPSSSGNWASWGQNLHATILSEDNAGGTTGTWRRWHLQGTPAFVQYGSGGDAYQGSNTNARTTGGNPTWVSTADVSPFAPTEVILHRIHLVKGLQTGRKDPNGGWVKDMYFATPEDIPNLSTIGTAAYAKLGNWLVMRWDGNVANPPVES